MNCCMVICSHHSSEDVSDIMFKQLEKYCTDNIKIYYLIDKIDKINIPKKYEILYYDNKIKYTDRLYNSIKNINYEYILILQEDFIICNHYDINRIDEIIKIMKNSNIQMMRSYEAHGNQKSKKELTNYSISDKNYKIMEIPKNATYQLAWQANIFEKNFLLRFLENFKGLGPPLNQLEIPKIQNWFRKFNLYYVYHKNKDSSINSFFYPHMHCINRGKWCVKDYKELKPLLEYYSIDITKRGYI